MAEVLFYNLKKEFNDNYLNYDWIQKACNSIKEKKDIETEITSYSDSTIILISDLNESFQKDKLDQYIKKIKNEYIDYDNKSNRNLFKIQPSKNTNFDISYNDLLADLFRKKYNEFNAGDKEKGFYGIANQACKMYEEQFNIEALTTLIEKNYKQATEIIYNKYNSDFLNQVFFEKLALENYDHNMKKEKNFKVINDNPKIECVYDNISLKIKMCTEIENYNLEHMIKMFNNREFIKEWFPFIEENEIKHKISKTKCIYYIKTLIPIIQDRELYLYGFLNAQFDRNKEGGILQFIAKSADDLSNKKPDKIFESMFKTKEYPETQRMYAHNITFEIIFDSSDIAKINLILDLNHGMTFVNIQLVELICKQLFSQLKDKMIETFSKKSKSKDPNQNLNLDRLQKIISSLK